MYSKLINLQHEEFFEVRATSVNEKSGGVAIHRKDAKSILTKATGFISTYNFTLNPYQGCQYGCSYCYAAAFSPDKDMRRDWGNWIFIKQNAEKLLVKELEHWYNKHPRQSPIIYLSSVTDPYQPIEAKTEITRALLFRMREFSPTPTLVIQTRSPLIVRDIDLLQRFERLRINMSIPTGSEQVRKDFEPRSPSIRARLNTLKKIKQTIDSATGFVPKLSVTITPTLPTPVEEQSDFIQQLSIVDRVVLQQFHASHDRALVAGTRQSVAEIKRKYLWWYEREGEHYKQFKSRLMSLLPNVEVLEGRKGFTYD